MTMITPSYLGETIEYSSLHACRSTLEDPTEVISTTGMTRALWSPSIQGTSPALTAGIWRDFCSRSRMAAAN